ncbi:MAG: hypothetical protein HKN04_03895, partial [Rhodothermaceae bacterium]|nr:hypothetical protein [Rhodothermaceae bacterium]
MSRLPLLLAVLLLTLVSGPLAAAQDTTGTPPPAEPVPAPPTETETPPQPVPIPPEADPEPEAPPVPTPPAAEQEAPPQTEAPLVAPPVQSDTAASPPRATVAPQPQPVEADTVLLPIGPVAAALARIRAAVADSTSLAPEGSLAPMAPALRGIVWEPPDSLHDALDELLAMRRVGARVVRTSVIADTLVLRAGDLLGLAFYQDLPIANLPAPVLLDTLDYATRLLNDALARAQPFASARHFGLTLFSDTSDPRMRPYVEQLTALARERGAPGTQVYYLTRFPESDRAAHL